MLPLILVKIGFDRSLMHDQIDGMVKLISLRILALG